MSVTRLYHDPKLIGDISQQLMQRKGITKNGEIVHRCTNPDHEDRNPSARWNDKKGVFYCDVCQDKGGVKQMAERLGIDLSYPPGNTATLQHPPKNTDGSKEKGVANPETTACNTATPETAGLTLDQYAVDKRIPVPFLESVDVTNSKYAKVPAIRIPYLNPDGTEGSVRFRLQLEKTKPDNRFRWRKGSKAMLYGLQLIDGFRTGGEITLLEGESCTQTAWYNGLPAIGLPGAGNWKEDRDAQHFEGFTRINVVIEPDSGGESVRKWLEHSSIRDRVYLIDLGEYEDVSGLWLACETQAEFQAKWKGFVDAAQKWTELDDREKAEAAEEARELSADLARQPDISLAAAEYLEARGLVGERTNVRVLYLALTSRLLTKPINVLMKGTSSTGKSYTTEKVISLYPESAVYAISGMSEKALIYDDAPLQHRVMVIYEAAGLSGDFQSYLMRSLLSEGRIYYVTVEKTADGLKPKTIIRDGPTSLIMTTTNVSIHPENETRMISLQTTDSQEQTRRILESIATPHDLPDESEIWHALQTWLESANHEVSVPFAFVLARMIPPIAVRLRRDFMLLVTLIKTNAILHQATRETDGSGQIIATLDDYRVAYEVAESTLSAGIESTVPESVRQTVHAVAKITDAPEPASLVQRVQDSETQRTASLVQIAKELKLDKSAASRRVRVATDLGYLRNLQEKRGRPARIAIDEALPEDQPLLPTPEELAEELSTAEEYEAMAERYAEDLAPTGTEGWEAL